MAKSSNSKSSWFGDAFRFGFGAGLGIHLSSLIFVFLGMLLLIPGIYLIARENKKEKKDRSTTNIWIGIVLMVIGVILGLGMGASFVFSTIMENI